MQENRPWFEVWFDSPWYHILYAEHDSAEAQIFADALLPFLAPYDIKTVLDLGCGKGRYARMLNERGLQVTGIDLSAANIEYAKQFENPNLCFDIGDMRGLKSSNFQMVICMFTSFGYFETAEDNLDVLKEAHRALLPGGLFLIDFFNLQKTTADLVAYEEVRRGQVLFKISRKLEGRFVHKEIEVMGVAEPCKYHERVMAFSPKELEGMFAASGFSILAIFGNYKLEKFDESLSERFIIVGRK